MERHEGKNVQDHHVDSASKSAAREVMKQGGENV